MDDYASDTYVLTEYEQEILDSIMRLYPEKGSVLQKLDRYIAYEQNRASASSDGKWHREFLPELLSLRVKLSGEVSKQRVDIDWNVIERLLQRPSE